MLLHVTEEYLSHSLGGNQVLLSAWQEIHHEEASTKRLSRSPYPMKNRVEALPYEEQGDLPAGISSIKAIG